MRTLGHQFEITSYAIDVTVRDHNDIAKISDMISETLKPDIMVTS